MNTTDYKFETFKCWTELLILLEVNALANESIQDLCLLHRAKFKAQVQLQDFNKQIKPQELDIFNGTNNALEIVYKWQETIIFAYKFLQYARNRGGTYGHKVGCLWHFLATNYEESLALLNALKKTEA
jgi:hypothetical protein